MANIKAKVTPQNRILVSNYTLNASTIRIGDVFDINTSNASDGAFLMYNGNTGVWEATTELDNTNTIINGGSY